MAGITKFIQSVNGGVSGFELDLGTNTKATITVNPLPIAPPGMQLGGVNMHVWYSPTQYLDSGTLGASNGSYSYTFSKQGDQTIYQVQVFQYATAPNYPTTYQSGQIAPGSMGITFNGFGIAATNPNPSTSITVGVVLSGGGGM